MLYYVYIIVRKEYGKYAVLRRISNSYEIMAYTISSCGGLGDTYKILMMENGTYSVWGVFWGYSWRGVSFFLEMVWYWYGRWWRCW